MATKLSNELVEGLKIQVEKIYKKYDINKNNSLKG